MPKLDLEIMARTALAILFVIGMGILAAFAVGLYLIKALFEVLFGY